MPNCVCVCVGGTGLRWLRRKVAGGYGHISHWSATVRQVGMGTFALFDNFAWGLGKAVSAQWRGLWGGALPRDLLRTRRARIPPSDSRRSSPPLLRPPPPPPSLRAEVSRGSRSSPSPHTSVRRTESQREPRLSPGSLSPRALTQPVSNRRLRLLSFFFFSPLLFFSSPVLPLSGLVTELWPIAALPAGAGCLLIGPLGARSRLPLLFPSKADKRRRLRARATGISQSLPSLSSLPPRSSPSLPPVPARVLWASTLGWRPAPGPYHSDRG